MHGRKIGFRLYSRILHELFEVVPLMKGSGILTSFKLLRNSFVQNHWFITRYNSHAKYSHETTSKDCRG